jgi:hypothetical protein
MRGKTGEICKREYKRERDKETRRNMYKERERERDRESKHAVNWKQQNNN